MLSILAISCVAVSAADVDDTIASDVGTDSIDLESVDDIVDDNALSAINDDESQDIVGADGDMSDLAPMYEPDKDYSENHIYDITPKEDTSEFLSHFREVSPGYTYKNPGGKNPIDIFWTAIENNTIYFIFYMNEEDYKDLHPRLTINDITYGDAKESTDRQDHIIYISETQDAFRGITVVKFINIPTTTTNGTLYVNRNHGDPIKDLPIKVLNQTNTTLYVNEKFEDTIYLGQDANLSAFVILKNFEDVKVTEGTVHYYLRSINGTKLDEPLEVGTSVPGDNPEFVPVKYLPEAIGDYIFSAWYEDYEDDHNFESHSNNVTLHVIEPPETDLAVEKSVDNDAPDFGTDVTYTITVTNNGPNDATGVQVTDKLPDGLVYVSDDSEGKYDSETGIWDIGDLANKATATLKIIATVNSVNSINNTAKITNINEEDTDPENDEDSAIVKANPIIDLAVVKKVDNDTPDFGSDVTYTITVTNNGPCDATGVQVTDKLPDGLVYVSDDSEGKYDSETGIWDIGALNNQSTVTLTIIATVKSTSEINNTAKVTDSNEKDNVTDNDEDSVIITPRPIYDVAVTIEITETQVLCGQAFEYIITVTNNGPCTAYNVKVTDVLPEGLSYITDNSTGNEKYLNEKALYASVLLEGTSSFDQSTGTWTVGDLSSGDTVKLAILAKAEKEGDYTISDSVTADDFELDTNDDNNEDEDTIKVIPCADLTIEKSVDKTEIKVGETVTYTITVTNNGPSDATGVKVTDSDITKHEFVSASDDAYDSSTGTWTIGKLANGESKTLTVTVKINEVGVFANTASVTGDQEDNDTSNNNGSSDNVTVTNETDDEVPDETPDETPDENPDDEVPDETPDVSNENEVPVLPKTGNPLLVLLFALMVLTGVMFERKE